MPPAAGETYVRLNVRNNDFVSGPGSKLSYCGRSNSAATCWVHMQAVSACSWRLEKHNQMFCLPGALPQKTVMAAIGSIKVRGTSCRVCASLRTA